MIIYIISENENKEYWRFYILLTRTPPTGGLPEGGVRKQFEDNSNFKHKKI